MEDKRSNPNLVEGKFTDFDGWQYSVPKLIEHSKDFPVFNLPLAGIHIGAIIFAESRTAKDIAEHVRRVNETSLEYPILLNDEGFIMDGWHRVVKALVEGHSTIKAIRFTTMPNPCGKDPK